MGRPFHTGLGLSGIHGAWLLFFVSARTNKRHHHQRGGEGDCVKDKKEGEEKESAKGSVHWGCYYATALDIEVDPHRFGCRESDFALQRLVECRALETERV